MTASSPSGDSGAGSADSDAFAAFYDATCTASFNLALHLAGDRDLAERACEAAYLDVMAEPSLVGAARQSLLLASLRTHALALRKHVSAAEIKRTDLGAASYSDTSGLQAAMANLNPAGKRAIELAYFGGLRVNEIAELTGASGQSVRALLREGLLALALLTRSQAEARS